MKSSDISIHLTPGLRLEQAMACAGVQTPASITKLTVTGTITVSDFNYIEKTMRNTLQELDLGNALVKSSKFLSPTYALSGLISITIPKTVRNFNYSVLENYSALTSIKAHPDDPFYSTQEGVLYNKDKSELLRCPKGRKGECTIPDSVTLIAYDAFNGCSGLTSVTIPASVVDIGIYAFYHCPAFFTVHPDNPVYESVEGEIRRKPKSFTKKDF